MMLIQKHSLFPSYFYFYYSLTSFKLPTNVPLIMISQDLSFEVGAVGSNPLRIKAKIKISFPHQD